MVQTGLRWAAWAALALVAWVLSASVIFLWLGGLLEARGIAPWQRPFAWLIYAPYAGRDLFETAYLAVSAVVFPAFALALVVRYRATVGPSLMRAGGRHLVRGTSDNHGHADWMPLAQARALFPGPQPPYGGVVVGEAYRVDQDAVAGARFDPEDRRSWGRGGAAPLLIDPCTTGPTHSLVFAGSGGFKTTSAISTLLHWTGSAVVLDPACEIGPMTARSRAEIGHRVHHLTLDDPACGLDVLDWIDISTPMAETHVRSVVWWLAGGESAGRGRQDESATFFKARGHALIACLLAHMLWGRTAGERPEDAAHLARRAGQAGAGDAAHAAGDPPGQSQHDGARLCRRADGPGR